MTLTIDRHPIRLAVVTESPALRDQLQRGVRNSNYTLALEIAASPVDSGGHWIARLREARPEAVILDLRADLVAGIRCAQRLADGDPTLQIVAFGPAPTPEFLLEVMRAGISEYLPASAGEEELREVLGRLARKLRRGGEAAREPARIYTLVSAKGGVGKTTIATNLAVELHRLTGRRALLIDLDLELGETALHLGVQPRFSLVDLVQNFHRMDANLLASYIEHHYTGVELLAAPAELERGDSLAQEQIRSVLQFLKQHYDYIVVDTPRTLSPAALTAIEETDQLLFLTTPDLPALRNARRRLPLLESHARKRVQGEPDRVRLLVNRYSPENAITLEDVSRTLELPVSWKLSSSYEAISHSVNRGEPAVLNGVTRYARELRALAEELAGPGIAAATQGGRGLAALVTRLKGTWQLLSSPNSRT